MHRPPYLGVNAEHGLNPLARTLHAVSLIRGGIAPHGVFHARMRQIVFKRSESVSHSGEQAVNVMLVFQKVEVNADFGIRGGCLISYVRNVVNMVGLSHSKLHHGEIPVFQVDAQRRLILPVIAKQHLRRAYQVNQHGKTVQERHAVFLRLAAIVCRNGSSRHKQHQQANRDA